ncbi:MAG: radical SAM protein [Deltaproteobacteria bacterium]|nr:radical SAM protein [Deltaproteobacteria bacterium]
MAQAQALQAQSGVLPARVISVTGRDEAALVHVAELRGDPALRVEYVDAVDPRYPRSEKWVAILSTQFGCPVGCLMCEAGGWYRGNLSVDEILWQVDSVVFGRYPDGRVPSGKFKVQFARMGEPSLNPAVLQALRELRTRYDAPGLIPCVATTAPCSASRWFSDLRDLKRELYTGGAFQLQFSVNSTDEGIRDRVMPVKKWRMEDIARYGEDFFLAGDRKVVLNFALAKGWPLSVPRLAAVFDPERFIVKITPLNPTDRAAEEGMATVLYTDREHACDRVVDELSARGFETIISIGSDEEMAIRSNCGQAVAVGRAAQGFQGRPESL